MFLYSPVAPEHGEVTGPLPKTVTEAPAARGEPVEHVHEPPEPVEHVHEAPEPHVHTASSGTVWDRLAQCESHGNWHINTGNGYYGGVQFSLRSWQWVGGTGYPHEHSREEQIHRAEKLLALQGWAAWPACSRKLGLRS